MSENFSGNLTNFFRVIVSDMVSDFSRLGACFFFFFFFLIFNFFFFFFWCKKCFKAMMVINLSEFTMIGNFLKSLIWESKTHIILCYQSGALKMVLKPLPSWDGGACTNPWGSLVRMLGPKRRMSNLMGS